MRKTLLVLSLLSASAVAEPLDNCATVLGSLAIELRHARALPESRRTTFMCPRERETRPLLGADKQRILRSMGPPDALDRENHAPGSLQWSYFFTSAAAGARGAGIPELVFSFDERQLVSAVHCQLTR